MKYCITLLMVLSLNATADVSQREARKTCVDIHGQQNIKVTVRPYDFEIYMKESKTYCVINRENR